MTRKAIFIISGLFLHFICLGQSTGWEKIFTIEKANISILDLDNSGKILLADSKGNLTQYDEKGDSVNYYSPTMQGKLSQLEARRSLNIFTFSYDLQRFEILDRFLNPLSSSSLRNPKLGNIKAASLGNNQKLWLYDETDFSLIQYDYQRNTVLQKQALNLIIDDPSLTVLEVTEYQNTVFINIKEKGIYLFDNQGNFIKSLPVLTEQKLSFHGNNLLTTSGDQLLITSYISKKQKAVSLPLENVKLSVGANMILLYGPNKITAYKLPFDLFES